MEEYDFEIQHRPGTKHGNADALSRRPCPVKSCACRQGIVGTSDAETGSALAVSPSFRQGRTIDTFQLLLPTRIQILRL